MSQTIKIDETKCIGCALCVSACREGAIGIVDGRAKLLREDHCDGLGNCLPVCPVGAISFEQRSQLAKPLQKFRQKQWPLQIKLVMPAAAFFNGADLLIAADCTAFAYTAFREEYMRDKITLIGCPKLDECDYAEKLTEIIRNNDIKSITVARMEVPCCTGLEIAAKMAAENSGKQISVEVVTISTDGKIIDA